MKQFGVVLLDILLVFYICSGSTHSKLRNSDRKQRNIYWIEALVASVLRGIAAHKQGESNFALYLHYSSFSE